MISDADINRRRLLAAAVLGAGGLALESAVARAEGPAPASPGTGSGFPRQAWATKDHRIAVKAPSETSRGGTAKDILLIHEQFGRFGMAHDELQFDVLHSLFAPDAALELLRGSGEPFAIYNGADAIVQNFQHVLGFQSDQRRHCFSNVLIEQLGRTTATALAYGIITVAHDGLSIGATAVYSARFVRKLGKAWQFSYLMIGMDDYAAIPPPNIK
jgi:hypothetical protein